MFTAPCAGGPAAQPRTASRAMRTMGGGGGLTAVLSAAALGLPNTPCNSGSCQIKEGKSYFNRTSSQHNPSVGCGELALGTAAWCGSNAQD